MARPGRQSVMKEMEAELTTERTWVKSMGEAAVRAATASLMLPKKRRSRTRCGMAGGGAGEEESLVEVQRAASVLVYLQNSP
ncbi:hypothetical protein PR202_gb00609 [Eleusine coracana subsp. coracana]|uniref:Uncharacterized protein n=1 Tax=Eleusine coracana subsp. coracana TaxID=191504 RepID=A0AAV5DS04_ELECO|nr:hypothetical protein PR202_gb00609 [Eleusine coracana subsp. coracana]